MMPLMLWINMATHLQSLPPGPEDNHAFRSGGQAPGVSKDVLILQHRDELVYKTPRNFNV